MYHTYVLLSLKGGEWHTGTAADLRARFPSPLKLIYYEACLEAADAYRRERFLKMGKGKRCLRERLKIWQKQFSRERLERH